LALALALALYATFDPLRISHCKPSLTFICCVFSLVLLHWHERDPLEV
jgi:hypothetical protein